MSFRTLLTTGAAVVALSAVLTGGAMAAVINSTSPTWTGTTGGSNITYGTQGSGDNTVTTVRWGVSTGQGQSGLGFDGAQPPASADIPPNTNFLIGTLIHYNNPIEGGTAASSASLKLDVVVAGATPATQSFNYNFLIDETPNQTPCAYPSTTPCADKITFQNLSSSAAFTIAGQAYTLSIVGFATSLGGAITDNFISQEGGSNNAYLYAKFTAPTPVPEPASLAILGMGLLGLGFAARRRQA